MFEPQLSKDFKNKKVRTLSGQNIEPQEVFLDKLAQKKEKDWGITEKKFEVPIKEKIAHIILGIFIFIIVIFFSKTFYLQVVQGKKFAALSDDNRIRISLIRAERGVIYDKDFNQLVFNSPSFDLICDKRDLPSSSIERRKEIEQVAKLLGKDSESLIKEIEESENLKVLISENLTHENLVIFETKIKDLPGFEIEENTIRDYVLGPQFSHLTGFTRKINKTELKELKNYSVSDYIGKVGLEKSYEDILRGKPGGIQIEKDALGNKKSEKFLSSPEDGKSLVLYLDSDLQKKITEELEKRLETIGVKKATAVALDPRNGGVLALVSLPSFDNNLLSKGISQEDLDKIRNNPLQPFFNRAISGQYPTGSIIKPLIATAALQEKIISPEKELYCPLELCLFNRYSGARECYADWVFHGWTDLRRAIAESVNPFFYMIGGGYIRPNFADSRLPQTFEGLGDAKIKNWLSLFGWGQKTMIDLIGESEGRVPDSEWKKNYFENPQNQIWTIGDTYNLSIGQGDLKITPLQVATAFVAVANGGTLYEPQVVQKIIDGSANSLQVIQEFKPKIIRENFIDPANLKVVREGMRQAVTQGISVSLNFLPVKAAAKTGTAQISKEDYYDVWITVFAPYDNPQIVLTIVIEEVKGISTTVVPVAREILSWYFNR